MNWKIGDYLIFKKSVGDCTLGGFTIGRKYKIIEKAIVMYQVVDDTGLAWWIQPEAFVLDKKEIKTEIDWLDAVKENFKYDD